MANHYPYGGPPAPPPQDQGGKGLRITLLLAAVAGVVTVVAGMLIVLGSPEEYGLAAGRDALPLSAQPDGKATGQPEQAMFQAAPNVPPPLPQVVPAPAMLPSTPVRIAVRRLGINAPIRSVGLAKDGTIQVPPSNNPNLVGWYRNMSTPGEAGPAVLLGHKDTRTRSAVFSRLPEIRNGDTIEVKRQDGVTAVFTVGGIEQADKKTFPTQRVYGPQANAQLHLITCGGVYNRSTGHYTDNVIVYATMTSSYRS
ncbi:class F sortase [Nonomuraea sp. LPB2021202275-12-8]|uniref:class F sortase n=1 Tax=Nonomuraea sp. LPB2021202275-12-8 TaxID=3120159 RepID=UPI00300CCD71